MSSVAHGETVSSCFPRWWEHVRNKNTKSLQVSVNHHHLPHCSRILISELCKNLYMGFPLGEDPQGEDPAKLWLAQNAANRDFGLATFFISHWYKFSSEYPATHPQQKIWYRRESQLTTYNLCQITAHSRRVEVSSWTKGSSLGITVSCCLEIKKKMGREFERSSYTQHRSDPENKGLLMRLWSPRKLLCCHPPWNYQYQQNYQYSHGTPQSLPPPRYQGPSEFVGIIRIQIS